MLVAVIPKPVSVQPGSGAFVATAATLVSVAPSTPETRRIARMLGLRVGSGPVALSLDGPASLGPEGYELAVTRSGIRLDAYAPAGLFYGVQTLRQLWPRVPAVRIRDRPRFAWRGAMLDVARHFRTVAEVKRYIDLISLYKLNRLHLHLSDDQGWRIVIDKWPRLAPKGGVSSVGGDPGGYWTQAQYQDIVKYAAARFVTIVPEIDMPGHVGAATSAYPTLRCDGKKEPVYTGMQVGFSSLCIGKTLTYDFVADVVGEIARLTPGPWFHIGGDEAQATKPADYVKFVNRVQAIVSSYGKHMIGWEEIARAKLTRGTIAQHWNPGEKGQLAALAAKQGAKVVMSPAEHAYLDMKYDASSPVGLTWAGYTPVRDAYSWDPVRTVPGVGPSAVLGVEAPLWGETTRTMADVEYLAFPRLMGIAEIGWSRARGRSWAEYRRRLGAQGPLLSRLGVRFYRSPEIPWR